MFKEAHSAPHVSQLRPPTTRPRRSLTNAFCSDSPPPIFRSGPPCLLSLTPCHIPARSSILWLKRLAFFRTTAQGERIMASPNPRKHKRLGRGVHNFDCVIWDRVREDAVLTGPFAKFAQNPVMKQHLLSTGTKILALSTPCGALVSGKTTSRPKTPLGDVGKKCSGKLFIPFATPFAQVRSGWHTPPPPIDFAFRPSPGEFMRFHQRRPALRPWPALAQVLPCSFRPVCLTRLLITVPRF